MQLLLWVFSRFRRLSEGDLSCRTCLSSLRNRLDVRWKRSRRLYSIGSDFKHLVGVNLFGLCGISVCDVFGEPRITYLHPEVSVVDSPPASQELVVDARATAVARIFQPRLILANEVHQIDPALVVLESWLPLILRIRSAVIQEAEPMPIFVLKVLVEQALICAIKAVSASGQRLQCPVISHVGGHDHHPTVEAIGPTAVGSSSESRVNIEELIGSSHGYDVGIDVYELAELELPPEGNLGEGVRKVGAIHQVKIGRLRIAQTRYRNHIVVKLLLQWSACIARRANGRPMATLRSEIESADSVSSVTRAASFFFVPPSRREWARTAAPGPSVSWMRLQSFWRELGA